MGKQSESDKESNEKRDVDRRVCERRKFDKEDSNTGSKDKRVTERDRRFTIRNRNDEEVSDRRSE